MRRLGISFLLILLLVASGCAPTCPPLPELTTQPYTQKLNFRIAGIILEEAPESEQTEIGIDYRGAGFRSSPEHFRLNYYKRIRALLDDTFIKGDLSRSNEKKVATLRVRILGMRVGERGMFSETRPHFAASYELLDPFSGSIIYSRQYRKDIAGGPGGEKGCSPSATLVGGFHRAINDCTARFIDDIERIAIQGKTPITAPFPGTLVNVDAELTGTRENTLLHFGSTVETARFWKDLTQGLPNRALTRIRQERLFSQSPENEYRLKIMIMKFHYHSRGWLSKKEFSYMVDSVLYRNGEEVASQRYDSTQHTMDNEEIAATRYMEMLIDFLKRNAG